MVAWPRRPGVGVSSRRSGVAGCAAAGGEGTAPAACPGLCARPGARRGARRGGLGDRAGVAGVRVPGERLEWRWRPWPPPPPPPCWCGRFLIMCSGSRRPEPGARERPSPGRRPRQHPRQEPRSRGRRCPEPGVNGCAAAGRVNEARRRGRRRRRRRRRRRCGDWDAPWSPTARSLWAGPETLPLPGPPPPPPTWFQSCAQAGPAGGREGGRTGGARGEAVSKRGVSV